MKNSMQRLINFFYRGPKSAIKTYERFGGYLNYRRMLQGNIQMKKAAADLPPSVSYPDGLALYFLTGVKYIHQTLFCISSLSKVSNQRYQFILVDDGTLTTSLIAFILKKLPGATIITSEMITKNLERLLPELIFPTLHQKRRIYPHIRKITDIHTIDSPGWKLVLDSDMLFWKEPKEMIKWLKNPAMPLHMVDCQRSYGYSESLMQGLSGSTVPDLVNVGMIGLNSQTINWGKIEQWISVLEAQEGTSYYLEQAISAMIIGQQRSILLNGNDYKVNPSSDEFESQANILHHYVDLSKDIYFKRAWRLIA